MAGHLSWVTKANSTESDAIAKLDAQECERARGERSLISEKSSALVPTPT
jgi:hypothetical protein